MDGLDSLESMARTDFVERSPLTRDALEFASTQHAGQKRTDGIPFVTHPVEVACLLHEAGYSDDVVAAGVLHDVIEETDANQGELEERFGSNVADLVAAVSDDPSIEDDARRKAALREQVAAGGRVRRRRLRRRQGLEGARAARLASRRVGSGARTAPSSTTTRPASRCWTS